MENRMAQKLSAVIQIPTVGYTDTSWVDYSLFIKLHTALEDLFPRVHQVLDKKVINDYSLLYKWKGTNPTGKSALYMAHMDVVPIAEGTEKDWKEPPFSGRIIDQFVWGRGALDTKVTMIGALEAVEVLLEEGFTPKEDVYLAFGHDEETQGTSGAKRIVEFLQSEKIELDYIVDEGGIVNIGSIKGVNEPVALVGISEKGYVDVTVSVKGDGGHASMPPKHTSLGKISQIINNMEKNQMPMVLTPTVKRFLQIIGPSMGGMNAVIIKNLWLFKPLFMKIFSKSPSGNALLRTTCAATMATASNASNVLPLNASATFNFRISPTDSVEKVIEHVKKNCEDIKAEITIGTTNEPSPISSVQHASYQKIERVIKNVFHDVLVAPYIVLAATDSTKYSTICKQIFRFAPIKLSKEELATIHNTNERISIENLGYCLDFYVKMMREN